MINMINKIKLNSWNWLLNNKWGNIFLAFTVWTAFNSLLSLAGYANKDLYYTSLIFMIPIVALAAFLIPKTTE